MAATATTTAPATQEAPQFANFANFNELSLEARVTHTEVKAGEYGEFLSVTCITNLADGQDGVAIQFRDSGAALKLAKGGHLMKGRRVHLAGVLVGFESAYTKDGALVPLSRPRLRMQQVRVFLGAKPKSAQASA